MAAITHVDGVFTAVTMTMITIIANAKGSSSKEMRVNGHKYSLNKLKAIEIVYTKHWDRLCNIQLFKTSGEKCFSSFFLSCLLVILFSADLQNKIKEKKNILLCTI